MQTIAQILPNQACHSCHMTRREADKQMASSGDSRCLHMTDSPLEFQYTGLVCTHGEIGVLYVQSLVRVVTVT
jgi:hypothetical protein